MPSFKIDLRTVVDGEKLTSAVKQALQTQKTFATSLGKDKPFYLNPNTQDIIIENVPFENRPLNFGKTTNDYLWRICYFEKTISFDFCHILTDGRGMARFVTTVLGYYFDLPCTYQETPYIDGYKKVYQKNAEYLGIKKQEKGFSPKHLPTDDNGYSCHYTNLSVDTKAFIALMKKLEASPVAVLTPLFSRALRRCLPEGVNKVVESAITIDCRGMTRVETSNNFITTCQISYLDKFDAFDIETIATIYRAIVGLNVLPENIVANTSKLVDDFSFLFKIKPYLLGKMLTKVVTKSLKKSAENFYITYIGKMPFTPELNEKIADVSFFVWPDSCPCCLAVLDFNGKIKITATENYKNREVMSVFRKELEENNIVCEKIGEGVFSQSRPRLQF